MMYQLLDSGNFQKLEQIGPFRLVRPAAQAVWRPSLDEEFWTKVDARYQRFSGGDGKWHILNNAIRQGCHLATAAGTFDIKLTDFGHLGIFPEQDANWARLREIITHARSSAASLEAPFQVLNLFAYTGGSSLAAAQAGAQVVHVDASKTSVNWARQNAELSGLADAPIRWIVEDVQRFVAREQRRGSRYQGIILDPPSFGRGPKGETWKIEEHLLPLLDGLADILAPDFSFILLSAHSTGYTPLALENLVRAMCPKTKGSFEANEMVVTEQDPRSQKRPLPSGAYCLFVADVKGA